MADGVQIRLRWPFACREGWAHVRFAAYATPPVVMSTRAVK